jgi:GH15 family glucan-1,4-alpha-glucosidase
LFERLERLGHQAVNRWNKADSGPWELRTRQRVHTYPSVMCWAACDRLARIASHLGLDDRATYWRRHADEIRQGILELAWNAELNSFVESFGGTDLDASLLLLPEIGLLPPDDPRFVFTLEEIERRLRRGNHVIRYHAADDFGEAETTFNICTFWYIDALVLVGRHQEARDLFEYMLSRRNSLGLLSEDLAPETGELWGNFPQTYSMVGLINSAMRLSKTWEDAF